MMATSSMTTDAAQTASSSVVMIALQEDVKPSVVTESKLELSTVTQSSDVLRIVLLLLHGSVIQRETSAATTVEMASLKRERSVMEVTM